LREASWLDDGSVDLLYFFDGSVLDTDRRELRRDGMAVDIEPQVFDLLEYLIRHRERVVSRDELIEQIWGGRAVSESALSTRINAVRNAIGDSGTQQRLLKTLQRKGIRFVGEAREEQKSPQTGLVDPADDATIEERQPVEALPALPAIGNAPEVLPLAMVAPPSHGLALRFGPQAWLSSQPSFSCVARLSSGVTSHSPRGPRRMSRRQPG
jgi:DNA-binding winged helix-turn-helix (wHTH) protein